MPKRIAIEKARIQGNNWLRENAFIEEYPVIIKRWDEWRLADGFGDSLNKIQDIYQIDSAFQELLKEKSDRIWKTSFKDDPRCKGRYEEFLLASRAYIFE